MSTVPRKLKYSEVASVREQLLLAQGGRCKLSGMPISPDEAVLDHCHTTGQVRGVLHRGVNSMLGKIENHRRIAGLSKDTDLAKMLAGVVYYLSRKEAYPTLIYPTHKTADEKRIARNAKARKRRAAAKET